MQQRLLSLGRADAPVVQSCAGRLGLPMWLARTIVKMRGTVVRSRGFWEGIRGHPSSPTEHEGDCNWLSHKTPMRRCTCGYRNREARRTKPKQRVHMRWLKMSFRFMVRTSFPAYLLRRLRPAPSGNSVRSFGFVSAKLQFGAAPLGLRTIAMCFADLTCRRAQLSDCTPEFCNIGIRI